MTTRNCDVFISYSHKDEGWVKSELLKRVEQAGLRAFIDFRDFTTGAPSIKEMERGVIECRKTLLVLTPDYIASEWADAESVMVQTLSPANRDLRMIPLLKTPCVKPLRIAALTHVDFTDGADFELAWRQLLTALGAAPEPDQPEAPSRDHWFLAHPYAMPPNFTGRVTERAMLNEWLTNDDAHPLLVLRALGGFGKSALTWHWLLHDVDPAQWPRVVWWSFYEGDASFESFVAETVRYLDPTSAPSASPRDQLIFLLKVLHSRGTLLILDGFERALRAFGGLNAAYQGDEAVGTASGERDCLSLLADRFLRKVLGSPGIQGKVLLTTRLRPAPVETRGRILLEGCREEELLQLQPADALQFFNAQGIRGGRAEIESACEQYGYHPLSLRLLAGLIVGDLQQPGDIAAAQRMDVSGDLVQRQHHVLQQAYASLGPARQKLLSRIACFRSPVSYEALVALAETELPDDKALPDGSPDGRSRSGGGSLDSDLRQLIARGLLHRDLSTNRFDLHPIVRRYAYDRLAASDRAGAHASLRDYFAAVPEPASVRSLDDLSAVIELYHHTVRAGQYDEACDLFYERLSDAIYFQLGAYQLHADLLRALFPDGEDRSPRLKSENDQAWALTALANSYSLIGQPRRALPLVDRQFADEQKDNLSGRLNNLSNYHRDLGSLRAAEANLRRSIMLSQEIPNEFREATGYQNLGLVLAYCGKWAESQSVHQSGLELAKKLGNSQIECVIRAYSAHRALLMSDNQRAATEAHTARELAEIPFIGIGKLARDILRTEWLLGAAHRIGGRFDQAEQHLIEALESCRRINMVDHEGNILIDLARLRMATAAPDEAQRLAEEALLIAERCGYVLQGADAHLVLAQLAKDRGDANELRNHATEALRLATCDGPPDYTYKAAYDEATALLR